MTMAGFLAYGLRAERYRYDECVYTTLPLLRMTIRILSWRNRQFVLYIDCYVIVFKTSRTSISGSELHFRAILPGTPFWPLYR
jgi:hypothetical protein